jgi:hypothetical protein
MLETIPMLGPQQLAGCLLTRDVLGMVVMQDLCNTSVESRAIT